MAMTQLGAFSSGDVNLTNLMAAETQVMKGYNALTLTHMDDTTVPAIAAGSAVEVNGVIIQSLTETAISGSPSDGVVYIYINGTTPTFTNTAPVWSDSKQGWYGTSSAANYRYVAGCYLTSGSYTGKGYFNNNTPIGLIANFGRAICFPYYICNGAAISRTAFAPLFSTIGTAFGVGDGTTTFNVPDFRGRKAIGLDNMGGTSANINTDANADSLGGTGGAETGAHMHTPTQYVSAANSTSTQTTERGLLNWQYPTTITLQDPYLAVNIGIKFI